MPTENYVPSKESQRRRRKRLLTLLFTCVGVLIVVIGAVTLPYAFTQARQEALIKVPHDATGKQLRDSLTKYLGEDYAGKVMTLMNRRDDDKMKRSGTWLITEGMSPIRAALRLTRQAQEPVRVTINGFRSVDDLLTRLSNKFESPREDIDKALRDTGFLEDNGLTEEQRLSLFIEDTYNLTWDWPADEIIDKFADNYKKVWNDERREKAEALGLTPAQVMILCSIVDEETNAASEKGRIGRLYINRLNKDMPLQADPTIRFALNDFSIKRVTEKHLSINSPYNTYKNRGLPPGPIRTTSVKTIDAVLDSKPSTDLYMCAKEDFSGTHNFSSDFATHQTNAARYQKALNDRNIH